MLAKKKKKKKKKAYLPTLFFSGKEPETQLFFFFGLTRHTSDSGSRGQGFEPHSSRRVVLEQDIFTPTTKKKKSTGNTQEAVAQSQHD